MSGAMSILYGLTSCFEIVSACVLVYAIAASKASSKKIIKAVLIGTVLYIVPSAIPVLGTILAIAVFTIVFCILGSQTGNKFNMVGFISLIAYFISLFTLPVIANKYEDSLAFSIADGLTGWFGGNLTPTQFEILKNVSVLSEYSDTIANYLSIMIVFFIGVILFATLLFEMILLRRNGAQMVMGGILSVLVGGMLYLDYLIFHSGSLGGKLAGMALSKMGFSLSWLCILIILFAVLTVVSAYRCRNK